MWAWRGVPEALAISFTGSVTAWIISMGRGLRGLIVKLDEGQSSELRAVLQASPEDWELDHAPVSRC